MGRVHVFQHVSFEGLAAIEPWLTERGYSITSTRFFEPHPSPDIKNIDLLLVMGGPMGVYEESRFPWITEEKRLIEQAVRDGVKMIGICLGSQMIASVLGARVYRNSQKEIGWHRVLLTTSGTGSPVLHGLGQTLLPFHWHGDTFDLPVGATHLARSESCEMQAFSYGENTLGLQFHIDSSRASIGLLLEHCSEDLDSSRWVQTQAEILRGLSNLPELHSYRDLVLNNLVCGKSLSGDQRESPIRNHDKV